MKQTLFLFASLSLFWIHSNSQLQIAPGTSWKSSSNTYVVLNDLGFKHDAAINSLDNIFKFTGISDDTISGATLPTFTTLQLAKTAAAKLFLGRSITANLISFETGLFELNNYMVDLGATGSISGESEASRFTGANGGYIQLVNSLNAPSSANPGNLGIIISSTQDLGAVTVRRGHKAQITNSISGTSILRYYDILPANNSSLAATIRLNYFNAERNNLPEQNLSLFRSADLVNWTNLGVTTRDTVLNYVEKTNINDLARFTLSDAPTAPLPVTGLFLTGQWANNASQLNWKTLAEYNNSHFNVERKYATENAFSTIGVKNSLHADGNSQSPTYYSWTDPASADRGSIEYRLKQVDKDGRFVYSNTVVIRPNSSVFIVKIYPTVAVKEQLYIVAGNKNIQQFHLRIFDLTGKLCFEKDLAYSSQWISLPLLSAGRYDLRITAGEWSYHTTFIKQ